MVRLKIRWMVVLSLITLHQSNGWSQSPRQSVPSSTERQSQKSTEGNNYRIYSLSDLGDDAEFCNWVANTIPAVIQPETWSGLGGTGTFSYHPGTKILVVYHSPGVHAQVDAFIKNINKSLPQEKGKAATNMGKNAPEAIQAQYAVPKLIQAGDAAPAPPYLIPAPAKQPKHLFHFIIRYEGDGPAEGNSQEKGKDGATDEPLSVQVQKAISKVMQNGDTASLSPNDIAALAKSKQLFHCIMRYEGEGIIDSNVVELIKSYLAADEDKPAKTAPVDPPASGNPTTRPENSTKPPLPVPPLPTQGSPAAEAPEPVKTPQVLEQRS